MSERNRLLQSIATIIEDYQAGILPTPTPGHVERWIEQFSGPAQQPILAEMEHVLGKTYFRKSRVRSILKFLIHHAGWTAGNPTAFWRQVHFLDLQPRGNSQRELLALFDAKLQKEFSLAIADCGRGNKFLYLDDGLFSGGRMKADLEAWIAGPAPQNAELLIAVVALHTQGRYFTERDLNKSIALSGKKISVNWTVIFRSKTEYSIRTYLMFFDRQAPAAILTSRPISRHSGKRRHGARGPASVPTNSSRPTKAGKFSSRNFSRWASQCARGVHILTIISAHWATRR